MSTAVALQDMSAPIHKESGGVRRRVDSKSSTENGAQTPDPWLDQPHDTDTSELPLDSQSLKPTSIYWITPHGLLSQKLTVLDLTKDMAVPYTSMTDEYKAEIKKTLKDHSFTPTITCHRKHWAGLRYNVTDAQGEHIADWSHPWTSVREATITFPNDSPHAPHTISLRPKRWGLRTESFTLNSQPYVWEMDSLLHSKNMTLYKIIGMGDAQKKVEVAKYAQKWWGSFVTGGTLVVDEQDVSGVVAALTLLVVLKKKRQRAAERNGHGGAGGN